MLRALAPRILTAGKYLNVLKGCLENAGGVDGMGQGGPTLEGTAGVISRGAGGGVGYLDYKQLRLELPQE